MANNTIKFDIKAAVDTGGLDEFVSQLRQLKDVAEPADRILGQAVKEIKAWADGARVSERNTSAATTAIRALAGAMTAGSSEYVKATKAAQGLDDGLRRVTASAKSANAVLNDFGKSTQTTNTARRQIDDLRSGLGDLIIQGKEYQSLLADIISREALLGRRTGRANVVAANQAYISGILQGFGAERTLQEMPNTTAALRQRLSELSQEFPNLIRNSERYNEVARQMNTIERELARTMEATRGTIGKRSASAQAKIDAMEAYYRDQQMQPIIAGIASGQFQVAQRRKTEFGDVPQVQRSDSGAFIAPPFKSSGLANRSTDELASMYAQVAPGFQPGPQAGSTAALRAEVEKLKETYVRLTRGTAEYFNIASQIRKLEREIASETGRSTQQTDALTQARRRLADAGAANRTSGASGFAAWSRNVADDMAIQRSIDRNRKKNPPEPTPTDLFQSISGISAAGQNAALQTMNRSYEQVAQQIRETARAAGGSTQALQAERQAWERLQGAIGPATREYKQAGREMQRLDRRLGTATRGERFLQSAGAISAGAFFGGPEGLIGGLAGMAIGGPGAALGGASIGAQVGIVRQGIGQAANYAAEIGKLRIALRGVVGDSEQYAKSLEVVNNVSTQLNIPVQEATQGFTRLAAAVVGAGGNVNDAEVVFRGVTSAIKATGGNAQDAQSAILALSQVFSKGKVTAEELQGQLGERLPGAVTLFAQATGRTLPQLSKDLEQGTVGLNDLIKFTELLSSKYAASALQIAKSTEDSGARQAVALSNLREEFGRTFVPLGGLLQDGASSWAEYATSVIKSINDIVNRYEFLREALKIGGIGLTAATPITGPFIAGMMASGRNNQSPQGRLAAAGSTTMYSDAQGNVYDAATGKLLMPAGSSSTDFTNPKSSTSDDKARQAADREKRKQEEAAARQQRLDLQIYNDQVRLQEQLAENRIRLEDRIFQHRQELLRREREQQQQLDQLRQQTLITSLSPEGRAAAGPIQELFQRLQGFSQNRQELLDRVSAAEQAVKSAEANAQNVGRFTPMYRPEDQSQQNTPAGNLQSSRPSIGNQFLSQILGSQFEDIAGLQPLPLERMYRQMGRQVQRWTNMVQNEARYFLEKTYGSAKPLIPQDIIDSTIQRVRVITNTIQSFDPLELQLRELENKARGASGQGRSKPSAISLPDFTKLLREIERRTTIDAANAANRAGGFLGELGRNADLSDFLSDGTRKFLSDGIRQILSSDEGGYKRASLNGSFSRSFSAFFEDTIRSIDAERGKVGSGRGGAGGYDSLELPATPRTKSGGVDYLMQYRNLQELMEPPRITPGVQNQFDGASLIPLLKKFESVASSGFIPVSIENPDVIAQATGRYLQGSIGPSSTGPHFDIKRRDRGYFDRNELDRYVEVNGAPLSSGTTLPGGRFYAPRTGRPYHGGWDYAFGNGASLGLKNGARWIGSTPGTANGDVAAFMTPDGKVYEIIHGRFAGSVTPGSTTTLSNGREIRTPGAAAAAMRGMEAAGRVDDAKANLKQARDELALFDRDLPALRDLSVKLGIEQTIQSLKDQEIALRDNYKEWKIRNRLQLEGVKPELIDFEINRERLLEQQKRQLSDMSRLVEVLGPDLDKIGKGDIFRAFIGQGKAEIEQRTATNIAIQRDIAQAAVDPYLEWQNKMNALGQSTRDFNDTLKLGMSLSDQFTGNLANGFSAATSAIVTGNGSIQQSFADLFNNIAKMFLDTIARVLADQLTMQFMKLLQPAPGSNQYTSIIGGLISSFGSGIVGSLGGSGFGDLSGSVAGNFAPGLPQLAPSGITGTMLSGFATGGISAGPTSGYPVMLHGTEAVIPLPNGRAVPVEMKGSGGTSVVVNVNMSTGESSVSSNERDGQLLGKALSEAVQAELVRQKRPGGILYG